MAAGMDPLTAPSAAAPYHPAPPLKQVIETTLGAAS